MLGFEKNYTLIKNSKETFCAVPKLLGHRTAVQRETCIAWPAHLFCYNFLPSPKPIYPLTIPSHEQVLSISNSSSPATRMWRTQKFSQCLSSRGRGCLFRQTLLKSVWVCVYMSVLFCSQVLQLKVACGLWNLTSVYVSVFQFVWNNMSAHCSAIIVGVGAGIVVIVTQEYFKRNNERLYN